MMMMMDDEKMDKPEDMMMDMAMDGDKPAEDPPADMAEGMWAPGVPQTSRWHLMINIDMEFRNPHGTIRCAMHWIYFV